MNSTIINQDGKTYKKAKVILLPTTNLKHSLIKYDREKNQESVDLIMKYNPNHNHSLKTIKEWYSNPYHLYIISETDEIIPNTNPHSKGLNGDYYYNSIYKTIAKTGDITDFDFKIIATTDNSLFLNKEFICRKCNHYAKDSQAFLNIHNIQYPHNNSKTEFETKLVDCVKCSNCGHSWCPIFTLPSPSIDFINKYIEFWNIGKPINEILVEYYRRGLNSEGIDSDLTGGVLIDKDDYYVPKVDKNNQIIITREKVNYTKEEMYSNMQYYMEYVNANKYVSPQEWLEKYKHF